MSDILIQFKNPLRKGRLCSIKTCSNKHYARGWCQYHYEKLWKKNEYRYSFDDYIKLKQAKGRYQKEEIKLNKNLKNSDALYKFLNDKDVSVFRYKDIETLLGWKYEKLKKHVLELVKQHKIIYIEHGNRSKNNTAIFSLIRAEISTKNE